LAFFVFDFFSSRKIKRPEVVRIGTRALIAINGKAMIATHWDGYPSSLGMDIIECDKSLKAIVEVAKKHMIDCCHSLIKEELKKDRNIQKLVKNVKSKTKFIPDVRIGPGVNGEDFEIDDIERYGDNAEYQYDIRGTEIYFRALKGYYPESLRGAEAFRLLTKKRGKIVYSCCKADDTEGLNK